MSLNEIVITQYDLCNNLRWKNNFWFYRCFFNIRFSLPDCSHNNVMEGITPAYMPKQLFYILEP